ncbi:MAG: hypothetical protein KDD50_15370, partial [Bdellovibrionales bacterium]|nr:hypothetical protein [Bdellovibrionales bacterium]
WRSWESRRDIDLYISYATKNPYLLQKILIGTPNIHYHNKIERLFDKKIEKQKLFSLSAHDIDPLQSKRIVEYQNFHQELRSSQYQQKLFSLITRDFYKPCNIGSLFENLYPKEYFNPLSSEKRLLNHVYRLNDNSTNNFFQLKKDKMDFIFLLNKNTELVFQIVNHRDRYSPSLKERIKKIGRKPFSSDELAKNLDCSQRKAQMLIKTMVIENFLFKLNLGNKTKYVMSCYKKEFSLNGNNI